MCVTVFTLCIKKKQAVCAQKIHCRSFDRPWPTFINLSLVESTSVVKSLGSGQLSGLHIQKRCACTDISQGSLALSTFPNEKIGRM